MITFTYKGLRDSRRVFAIGLSDTDLKRLGNRDAISCDAEPFGMDFDVQIFSGSTDEGMAKALHPDITAKVVFFGDYDG